MQPDDKPKLERFAEDNERIAIDNFFGKVMFSDESIFHLSGKVNRHNVRI